MSDTPMIRLFKRFFLVLWYCTVLAIAQARASSLRLGVHWTHIPVGVWDSYSCSCRQLSLSTLVPRFTAPLLALVAEFESVLGFRQLPSVALAYGVSDMHILCRLRTQPPAAHDGSTGEGGGAETPVLKPCPVEIAEARWASLRAVTAEMLQARTQAGSEQIVCPLCPVYSSFFRYRQVKTSPFLNPKLYAT